MLHLALCSQIRSKHIHIYIYMGCALCTSLLSAIYTYIWAIYTQSKPCIHIYWYGLYGLRFVHKPFKCYIYIYGLYIYIYK